MSPRVKKSALNIGALIGAIVALSGLIAPMARAVDDRFVKSEQYRLDSLRHAYELQRIEAKLAKIDTVSANMDTVKACIKHRDECR